MQPGDLHEKKKKLARRCPECGQCFQLTIKFCPEDGSKLSDEVQTSREIIKITDSIKLDSGSNSGGANSSNTKTIVASGQVNRSRGRTSGNLGERRTNDPFVDAKTQNKGPIEDGKNKFVGMMLDDQYEILSVIGQGGMSVVYKARHLMMKKILAVKTLLPHLVLHPHSLERFRQEAEAASNLHHPNIVTIHHFGFTPEGQPYLVMDYLEGTSLHSLIRRDRHMPIDRACHIFAQIADALAHAHGHGVIHRDLKPSNILLVEHGSDPYYVKIVDFGIAKLLPQEGHEAVSLTQTGELFGSPLYMSPEQCKGERLDAKSDVYSMGCLMYETIAGKPPLDGENTLDVLYKHINAVPPSITTHGTRVPEKLETIIFKCLAKSPAQRYQSMDALREDLLDLLQERTQSFTDRIFSRWELMLLRRKPRSKKDRLVVLMETAVLLSILLVGAIVGFIHLRASSSPNSKQEIIWTEDQAIPAATPTSDVCYKQHDFDVGFGRYQETKLNNDPQRVQDLISKLMEFGRDTTERHLFDVAANAYHQAWQVSVDYNGAETISSFMAQGKYADALREKGDKSAAKIYQTMLDRLGPLIHDDDPYSMGLLYERMGQCFYAQHLYDRAEPAYQTALYDLSKPRAATGHRNKVFANPTDDSAFVEITSCQCHLAHCKCLLALANMKSDNEHAMRQLKSAADLYFEGQKRWRESRGDFNHDETVATYRLAQTYHQLGNDTAAAIEFESAIEHARKVFGPKSVYIGLMLRGYSDFLWDRGNYAAAAINRLSAWTILADAKE